MGIVKNFAEYKAAKTKDEYIDDLMYEEEYTDEEIESMKWYNNMWRLCNKVAKGSITKDELEEVKEFAESVEFLGDNKYRINTEYNNIYNVTVID